MARAQRGRAPQSLSRAGRAGTSEFGEGPNGPFHWQACSVSFSIDSFQLETTEEGDGLVGAVSLPARSSRSDGWRPFQHPCRRGNTHRTGYDRENADRFEIFPNCRRRGAGPARRARTSVKAAAIGRPPPLPGSSSRRSRWDIPPEILHRNSDDIFAAIRSSDNSRETTPVRANWNFR